MLSVVKPFWRVGSEGCVCLVSVCVFEWWQAAVSVCKREGNGESKCWADVAVYVWV